MLALLQDPTQARQMGERGVERVAAHFPVERYVGQVMRVYDEVMHER